MWREECIEEEKEAVGRRRRAKMEKMNWENLTFVFSLFLVSVGAQSSHGGVKAVANSTVCPIGREKSMKEQ